MKAHGVRVRRKVKNHCLRTYLLFMLFPSTKSSFSNGFAETSIFPLGPARGKHRTNSWGTSTNIRLTLWSRAAPHSLQEAWKLEVSVTFKMSFTHGLLLVFELNIYKWITLSMTNSELMYLHEWHSNLHCISYHGEAPEDWRGTSSLLCAKNSTASCWLSRTQPYLLHMFWTACSTAARCGGQKSIRVWTRCSSGCGTSDDEKLTQDGKVKLVLR